MKLVQNDGHELPPSGCSVQKYCPLSPDIGHVNDMVGSCSGTHGAHTLDGGIGEWDAASTFVIVAAMLGSKTFCFLV